MCLSLLVPSSVESTFIFPGSPCELHAAKTSPSVCVEPALTTRSGKMSWGRISRQPWVPQSSTFRISFLASAAVSHLTFVPSNLTPIMPGETSQTCSWNMTCLTAVATSSTLPSLNHSFFELLQTWTFWPTKKPPTRRGGGGATRCASPWAGQAAGGRWSGTPTGSRRATAAGGAGCPRRHCWCRRSGCCRASGCGERGRSPRSPRRALSWHQAGAGRCGGRSACSTRSQSLRRRGCCRWASARESPSAGTSRARGRARSP
mmetsp:Transcript_101233/g.227071  ORF Transcript_101233/g.227071 Transcript_101233/m.227071 type:complete len:261 (-) Transcript_101233:18-800(-)